MEADDETQNKESSETPAEEETEGVNNTDAEDGDGVDGNVENEGETEGEDEEEEEIEEPDTIGAEIAMLFGDVPSRTSSMTDDEERRSTRSQISTGLKSVRSSIASTLRRFSMSSKASGLNFIKGSQLSLSSRKSNDYLDPVTRRQRQAIGKVTAKEEHTEFLKTETLPEFKETLELMATLLFFPDTHADFPGQYLLNVGDLMEIEMEMMQEYMQLMNQRIDRLGLSPSPPPPETPPRIPTPNFFENLFCYHRYLPSEESFSSSEQEEEEEEEEEEFGEEMGDGGMGYGETNQEGNTAAMNNATTSAKQQSRSVTNDVL